MKKKNRNDMKIRTIFVEKQRKNFLIKQATNTKYTLFDEKEAEKKKKKIL